MDTAVEKEERRSAIESEFNGKRDQLEKDLIAAREAVEEKYRSELASIEEDRRAAFEEAGLNPDGSTQLEAARETPEYFRQKDPVVSPR